MRARRNFAAVMAAFAAAGCSVVLGIDIDYSEQPDGGVEGAGEAGIVDDAPSTVSADVEAGPCTGHLCDGICLPGPDCSDCKGAPLFCTENHACVAGCSSCEAGAVECWSCEGGPRGSCHRSADAYCLRGEYARCDCDGGASDCPGQSHVCSNSRCETCGTWGTNGRTCKSGLACSSSKNLCEE